MSARHFFIFEMANNHMGDVAHGIAIVKALREATRDFDFRFAVKLQYRNLPDFIHPDFRTRTDLKFIKRFTETALSWDQYRELKDAIVAEGFLSMCTPWDEVSVDKIVEHGYDYLKIPSCYLTDWPLAEKVATTHLPLVISTAGESFDEIDRVVSFYQHRDKKLAIMHCVGEYPTSESNLQLNQIDLLKRRYGNVEIGYSTHESPDQLDAVKIAIGKGATLFEKHVGLPTAQYSLNQYSANPAQIRAWLESANRAIAMCGATGERHEFSSTEKRTLRELQRGVFAKAPIAAGEVIRSENVFLSIPVQEGQLVANDLSKYNEFKASHLISANGPILDSAVSVSDTRSAVHGIVRDVKALLETSGAVVPAQLELEISHHYGIERFREVGSAMITVINREYCKRLLLMLPGQSHPEHWHKTKDETFHLLHGSIDLVLDGVARHCEKNDVIVIPRGAKHAFVSATGVVIEEVSSNHAYGDSCYTETSIPDSKTRKTYVTNWMG